MRTHVHVTPPHFEFAIDARGSTHGSTRTDARTRFAAVPMESVEQAAPPAVLSALPHDVLVHIAALLRGKPALALSSCCKPLRTAALTLHAWEQRLQWELGFTPAGISRWQQGRRGSLVGCFLYCSDKHEALEVAALRQPQPVRAPGWRGCCDVRVCFELTNDWPFPIWTFLVPVGPGGAGAPWAAADELALHPHAGVYCTAFEASHGRELRVMQLACAQGAGGANDAAEELSPRLPRTLPPIAQPSTLLGQGWVQLVGEEAQPQARAVPAVAAVPLAADRTPRGGPVTLPMALRRPPTVLSPVTLRLDAEMWEEAQATGRITLAVLQAADVRAAPLDSSEARGVELAAAVAAAARRDSPNEEEEDEADPFQRLSVQDGQDGPPPVFQRPAGGGVSAVLPADLGLSHTAAPPARLVFTALRRTTAVLELT